MATVGGVLPDRNTATASKRARQKWNLVKHVVLYSGILAGPRDQFDSGLRAAQRFAYVLNLKTDQRSASMIEAIIPHALTMRFFESLGEASTRQFVACCRLRRFVDHQVILPEGEESDSFFVVNKGAVELFSDNAGNLSKNTNRKPVFTLRAGDTFGEMAHTDDAGKRTGSMAARGRITELLEIGKKQYLTIVHPRRLISKSNRTATVLTPFVSLDLGVPKAMVQELHQWGLTRRLPVGFQLLKQGQACSDLCIVIRGELSRVVDINVDSGAKHTWIGARAKQVAVRVPNAGPGEVIGEATASPPVTPTDQRRSTTVPDAKAYHPSWYSAVTITPVEVLALPRFIIRKQLNTTLRDALAKFANTRWNKLKREVQHAMHLERRVQNWRGYVDDCREGRRSTFTKTRERVTQRLPQLHDTVQSAATVSQEQVSFGATLQGSGLSRAHGAKAVTSVPILPSVKAHKRKCWHEKIPRFPQGLTGNYNSKIFERNFQTPFITPLPSSPGSPRWDIPRESEGSALPSTLGRRDSFIEVQVATGSIVRRASTSVPT